MKKKWIVRYLEDGEMALKFVFSEFDVNRILDKYGGEAYKLSSFSYVKDGEGKYIV